MQHCLNAESAWQTQLFLYISQQAKIGKAFAQRQHPTILMLGNLWNIVWLFWEVCSAVSCHKCCLSNKRTPSFPLHFQPGNLHFSALLSSLLPVLFAGLLLLFSLFSINKLMLSIFSSQLLLSNLKLTLFCSGVMRHFPCYCSVLWFLCTWI